MVPDPSDDEEDEVVPDVTVTFPLQGSHARHTAGGIFVSTAEYRMPSVPEQDRHHVVVESPGESREAPG